MLSQKDFQEALLAFLTAYLKFLRHALYVDQSDVSIATLKLLRQVLLKWAMSGFHHGGLVLPLAMVGLQAKRAADLKAELNSVTAFSRLTLSVIGGGYDLMSPKANVVKYPSS